MIESLSIAVHAFVSRVSMSFSVDEWNYLTKSRDDEGVHIFSKGICSKVNIIARLEFELAYNDSALTITPRGHSAISFKVHPIEIKHINLKE